MTAPGGDRNLDSSAPGWLRDASAPPGAPTDRVAVKHGDHEHESESCIRECRKAEAAASTPASSSKTGPSSEFVEQAARRLAIAGVVFSGVILVNFCITLVIFEGLGWKAPPHLKLIRASQLSLMAMSFLVFFLASTPRLSAAAKLNVGSLYQVLGAFGVALPAYYCPEMTQHFDLGHISWLCVWIIFFPLVVPMPLPRALLANLLSASMAPLVLLILGAGFPGPQASFEAFGPAYICAFVALAPAYVMVQLGREVSHARREARRLGSYQLVERLGKGGMGEVWRAEHSMLARPAAVKLIRGELLGAPGSGDGEQQTVLARFEREARATAALRSPHTVSLYDFGMADDGSFYYVMELLEGVDLETLVEKYGPVPPARAVHLLAQACDSLAEAHAAGLVHRDVKPANIYACRLGLELDFVKVLDFGLVAQAKFARAPNSARLTGEGFIVGTPAFMAPEMVSEGDVDARADIYALGCVAYWLLTGRQVFEADKPMQIMIDHARTAPVPPSRRYEKRPIPARLDDVVMACLAKAPKDRPQDARALKQLLLDALPERWTHEHARLWWEASMPALAGPVGPNDPTRTPRRPGVPTITSAQSPAPAGSSQRGPDPASSPATVVAPPLAPPAVPSA